MWLWSRNNRPTRGKTKASCQLVTPDIQADTEEQLAKEKQREAQLEAKKVDAARKKMELELFRPAQIQKVPFGTGRLKLGIA